jgi:predicted unusual protein kinase regulating ubiquinone biosynthesis (AarF/ABC1/UbiB family)
MTTANDNSDRVIDRARYRHILWFFAGVILHLVWWDLILARFFKGRVQRSRPRRFRRISRKFRELAIEMGGVLIKLGQFLSSRVDVLPPEITEELAGLQDEVPPVPFVEIETVLTAELGDLSAHFAAIRAEPVAAASLGQAHRAWISSADASQQNPIPVIVKVQRPGIENIVATDLSALRVVARWAMRYRPIRRRADAPALMEEFARTLWEELDYVAEAGNAERFAQMFAEDAGVRIPDIYRQHSTRRVLVLEDVGGIKITDVDSMAAAGIERSEVASRLLDAYFQQIFKEGFFHADPHPGNLFVLPMPQNGQATQFQVAFVDFGMVGHIEELMGENLQNVLVSITQRDARGLTKAYNDLGFFLPGSDLDRISEAQEHMLNELWGQNLLELSRPDPEVVQEFSSEFRDILYEFPFQVPQDFIFLGRALGMLSGLATLLDPNINPWHLVERYGREIIKSKEGMDFGLNTIAEWLRLFVIIPGQAQRVLAAAEQGRLRVRTVPDRALLRRLDRIDKRLSRPNWGILAAALLLSGTLLYVNDEEMLAAVAWIISVMFILLSLIRRE